MSSDAASDLLPPPEAPAVRGRSSLIARRARRALRKPPRELARRLVHEAQIELERVRAPRFAQRFDEASLLRATGADSLDELWRRLARRPYPTLTSREAPTAADHIVGAAQRALDREVDLLGSGPHRLGTPIDWHRDFKTGVAWPPVASHRIDYADLGRPSDVKVPWELSRLQWLIPVAQAYRLDGDERRAGFAADVLSEWIAANPYGRGVNWIVAMEAALRVLTWTWLFRALHDSDAWRDPDFRRRFLTTLFLHGHFVERNLERSDVNGNHYVADAAGLVFAGLFFGEGEKPARWAEHGWKILVDELPRQVHEDGVDFEASTAYHRLVGELFLLPALYRLELGLDMPPEYAARLLKMAEFVSAYTRPDGTSPLWGDADDGRALPLDGDPVHDHRSLVRLVEDAFGGDAAGARCASQAFPAGGVYILRSAEDHVFIDCGPVGTAGRGGHGHNDCLSFEAVLDGVHLVSDSGSFVYTASREWRNRFRSTAFHSTPMVDAEEQNRLDPSFLWRLENDAVPEVRAWETGSAVERFCGSHSGYRRLSESVTPVRTIELDHGGHRLVLLDDFEGGGVHGVAIPLQLAPGVGATDEGPGRVILDARGRRFELTWADSEDWTLDVGSGWVAPSYGVRAVAARLEWRRSGPLLPLRIELQPGAPA